jgi:chemotaxis protein MotB
LMWLLNATTEQQRKGLADYFSSTIPINRVSGGGDGAFGGDSIFSEMTLPKSGIGGTDVRASQDDAARGNTGNDDTQDTASTEVLETLEEMLVGRGGESMVMENALQHIVTRITDEGLVIELFELAGTPLFEPGTDTPTQLLLDLSLLIASTARTVTNGIAVSGHVQSRPVVLARSKVWEQSAARAAAMRQLLEDADLDAKRIKRVTGHADRSPVLPDTMAPRNNRIEVIILRDD